MNNKCPLCGKEKRAAKDLVCAECYQFWVGQAGHALASEGKVIPFTIWAFEKVKGVLYPLREELEKLRADYEALGKAVSEAAYAAITTALGGKRVEPEVFRIALKEKRDALWKEKGGNQLHYRLKTTETRVALLEGIYAELKNKMEKPEGEIPPTAGAPAETLPPPPTPEESEDPDGHRPCRQNNHVRGGRAGEKVQLRNLVATGQIEES